MRRRERPVAGRYVLLEELGRGATGVVRRALDLRRRTYVAAKVLHDPTDAAALARFVREQAHRVDHPHVAAPTGWAADDDTVLLTMTLARGGSLCAGRAGRAGRAGGARAMAAGEAVLVLDQLLDALAAVHAAGLVHGDVKPANLLLRDARPAAPHVLLADFGVATPARAPLEMVALVAAGGGRGPVGTPAYLPPELREGGAAHPGQDVYAAGVLARRLVPPGPLTTLWDSMTRREPERRPSAEEARRRLRELSSRR